MSPSILLTGATGTIGSELTRLLAEQGVPVRLFVRTPEKALTAPTVELVQGDLSDRASIAAALDGIETLFLLSSPSEDQVALQGNAVAAAREAGVNHIVKVAALGTDLDSPVALARWHGQTEQQIREAGVAYTFLRPHSFMQNLLGSVPTIQAQGAFYGVMGDAKISIVDARDVAAVAAAVLTNPAAHTDQVYSITGPEALSYPEMAAQLSEALSRSVQYVDVPVEAYRQGMIDAGLPAWLAADLATLGQYFATGAAAAVSPVVREVTGRPGTSFRRFARDYAAAFA